MTTINRTEEAHQMDDDGGRRKHGTAQSRSKGKEKKHERMLAFEGPKKEYEIISQPVIVDHPSKRELSISKRFSAGKTPSDTCRREISVSVRWERHDGGTKYYRQCAAQSWKKISSLTVTSRKQSTNHREIRSPQTYHN